MEKTSKTKASRRSVLKGAALGVAALGAGSVLSPHVARAASTKVRVINASGNFAKVQEVLLDKLKLWDKYDIDADNIDVSDTNKILASLIGGDGDLCPASGYSTLFPAIEKGGTVKILAASGVSPLNILYSSKSDIKSVKDLPGRTVGTGAPGALLHELVVATLKKYGVDYKKVSFVNVGSNGDVFRALAAGTVDAGAGPIDFRDTAAKYNLTVIPDGEFYKELPLFVNQAMFASDRAIADNRKGLIGVMAAYADMFRWLQNQANKPKWMEYYKVAFPNGKEEEANFLYDFVSAPGRLASNLLITPEQVNYIQELNVELGVQKTVLPYDKCTDMSLAEKALKLVKA